MTGSFFLKQACLATTLLVPIGAMVSAQAPSSVDQAAPQAAAQRPSDATGTDEAAATIIVTGSRVATANNAPTPITMVSPATLAATTPSTLPQALAKLPVFMGSTGTNVRSGGGSNNSGTQLNLRNFGVNRNLILLDGHRIAPNNSNGSVNIDIIPEMLVDRIDVVTGGASAVYGSDAVTGVVNFILNKKFNGFKVQANYGLNGDGVGERYQAGIAFGTDLFEGRGHFEATVRGFHQNQVLINQLPYGKNGAAYAYSGNGSAATPYTLISQARRNDQPVTGLVNCGACAANGLTFIQNGILGPLDRGIVTAGSPNLSVGGQGRVDFFSAAQAALKNGQAFGRFSFDVAPNITLWVQGRGALARYFNNNPNNGIPAGTFGAASARPNIFFTDNPFLTPATRALIEQGNTQRYTDLNGVVHTYFSFINYQPTLSGTESPKLALTSQQPIFAYVQKDRNISGAFGVDGKLGTFDFNVTYSHDDNLAQSINPANNDFQAQYAANDAVQLANGSIVCYVSTTANASLYPGCVPANPFGYDSLTRDQYAYYQRKTSFKQTNRLDNIEASIAGTVFDLPAGPLKAALSGNARWAYYKIVSDAEPVNVNCGVNVLRLCNNNTPRWFQTTLATIAPKRQDVQEAALEFNIPVLKDIPFIQSLSFDIAGRYTHYSTSGNVKTWKVGGDYRVNDTIRFRGTASSDIRAPTLNDLFLPQGQGVASLADLLTGRTADTVQRSQGNPTLTPERARTYTAGVVITPRFLPGFSFSADYYKITLKNAITTISYTATAVQQVCIAAVNAGSGATNPYCQLATRPNPLTDRTLANFPSSILQQFVNSAVQRTKGWDFEANYRVPMDQMSLPGSLSLRGLLSYQPYLRNTAFTGAVPVITPQPHYRANAFVSYTIGDFGFNLQDRWLSSWDQATFAGQIFAKQRIRSYNQLDVTLNYEAFAGSKAAFQVYVTVEDVFNRKYPVAPTTTSGANPGIAYPVPTGFGQVLNRYFTFGVRKQF